MAMPTNPALARIAPADIRNVLLTGHTGCGKTSLVERILFDNKNTLKLGTIAEGTTVGDYEPEEKLHKHSLKSSLTHFVHDRRLFNLIDAPGSGDFLGQALAAFAAVETVLVVIDAAKGIEVTTRRIMKIASGLKIPRMIVINKIDHEGADLLALLAEIDDAFGPQCLAINLPIRGNSDVIDVLDHGQAPSGEQSPLMPVADAHQRLLEQIVEMDEELTGEYFEKGDQLDPMKLHRAFENALASGHLVPIMFCSAKTGAGIADLLHVLAEQGPSPLESSPPALTQPSPVHVLHDGSDHHDFATDVRPEAACIAHVFKIINDPFLGKLSVVRVVQGTLKAKQEMLLGESKKPVRIAHLFKMLGKEHVEVEQLICGDIGVIPKLEELRYNSILHADPAHHSVTAPAMALPRPLYGIAVELKNHADEAKFATATHKMMEEDPCFAVERLASTGQTVFKGLGELHLRIMQERLKSRFGVELNTLPMKVAYRETITTKADGHHRHKKQTGGSGQFGEVYLRVEPLESGHPTGFEFVNETVGGSVPRQYLPAIEKGCRQVLSGGAIAGYPLTGVRVAVYDGKYHDVDSKEIAFVTAGKRAFIDAIAKARPALLEPFVRVEVSAPARHLGDLTADLSGRRGRIESSEADGEMCTVVAVAPLAELMAYATELKSMTGGQGSYSMEFSHEQRTPLEVQTAVVSQYKPQHEEE